MASTAAACAAWRSAARQAAATAVIADYFCRTASHGCGPISHHATLAASGADLVAYLGAPGDLRGALEVHRQALRGRGCRIIAALPAGHHLIVLQGPKASRRVLRRMIRARINIIIPALLWSFSGGDRPASTGWASPPGRRPRRACGVAVSTAAHAARIPGRGSIYGWLMHLGMIFYHAAVTGRCRPSTPAWPCRLGRTGRTTFLRQHAAALRLLGSILGVDLHICSAAA